MKITKEIWSLGELERIKSFSDILAAIEDAAYKSTDELIGRLVECICGDESRLSKVDQLGHILGSGYEVEE